jgi:hypothetical protein
MFVDAIMRGSAERVNPASAAWRSIAAAPSWGCLRYPFKISDATLAADCRASDDPQTAAAITGAARRGGVRPSDPAARKADSRAVLVYADARCRSAGLLQLVYE